MALPPLPVGVRLRTLTSHPDPRGTFTELFRQEWDTGITPVQWNVVSSEAGVFRGVHVHVRHEDYLVLLSGRMSIGLVDLRPESPTEGLAAMVELAAPVLQGLTVPVGVAHGFYFHEPSVHVYSVDRYFDGTDEFGCHWQDPALGLRWPASRATLSARDEHAPSLAALREQLAATQIVWPVGV